MSTKRLILGGLGSLVITLGVLAFLFRADLSALMVRRQLDAATTAEERLALATDLLDRGPAGLAQIETILTSGSPDAGQAIIDAVAQLPIDDDRFRIIADRLFANVTRLDDSTFARACSLIPAASTVPELVEPCRDAVRSGLTGSSARRLAACRVATRPGIDLAAAVAPLLGDTDPAVRQAALLAIGPMTTGRFQLTDEEIFKLLSDPDRELRMLAAATLTTRGRTDEQIELGRKLMHPDPRIRLSLLMDLKWTGTTVNDPGPWLARLAKDSDPAVRAGAARVAVESQLLTAAWLDDLADRDPDPLVRSVANHYRDRAKSIRTVGGHP